ncbi:MAG: AI-2E family transporter [Nitrospirae bacterium]|nr:AI-2E family transporter [Nitrospirota bacterium]
MKEKTLLFYAATAGLLYLAFKMFSPFLLPIFWAVVMSIVLYPLYKFISVKIGRTDIAAAIVVFVSLVLFVGPISYFSYLLAGEIREVIRHSSERGIPAMFLENNHIKAALDRTAGLLDMPTDKLYGILDGLADNTAKSLVRVINDHALVAVHAVVDYFIMLFTIFFLLLDGQMFIAGIYRILPLSEGRKDLLIARIKEVIVSTMYGGVLIALVHGVIGGSAFYLLGVPSPILLGFAMSVFSFIPVIGAFTVWGPVTAYLFLTGSIIKGLIMAFIGVVCIVGVIDHVLKPKVIGQRAKIHTVLIFFGVLGGIHSFGVIGFVAGPLVIAVLLLVMESIEKRLEE